jgi:hypothetical protein
MMIAASRAMIAEQDHHGPFGDAVAPRIHDVVVTPLTLSASWIMASS